jgi:hypothetical protein
MNVAGQDIAITPNGARLTGQNEEVQFRKGIVRDRR